MNGFELLWSLLDDAGSWAANPAAAMVALVFLGSVLTVSGVSKVRRPGPAATAIMRFGVTARHRPRIGLALGWAELAVAAMLFAGAFGSQAARVVGAWVATGVFVAFCTVIARSLRARESFACHCFGENSAPLSRWTLARAGALAVLAAALVVAGPSSGSVPSLEEAVLGVGTATALLGGIVLVGLVPRLVRWNADPFGLDLSRWERR